MMAEKNTYKYATMALGILLVVVAVAFLSYVAGYRAGGSSVKAYNSTLYSTSQTSTTYPSVTTSTPSGPSSSQVTSTTNTSYEINASGMPNVYVVNGTTTIVFVPSTTTIPPPLWRNTTTIAYTTTIQPNQCYADEEFYCGNIEYSSTTGNLTLELGQGIGTNWTNVYIAFVPKGAEVNNGVPNVSFNQPNAFYIGYMHTGFGYDVTLPVSAPQTSVGTKMSGSIWMKYTPAGGDIEKYLDITPISMEAVSTGTSITSVPTTSATTTTVSTTTV
jgi:hypothetical protein